MNISKTKWFNFFIFPGTVKYLFALVSCLVVVSYLGALTPGMITDLPKNYENETAFYNSLWSLFFLFCAVYINRVAYQVTLNKYMKLLMKNARKTCYSKWLHSFDVQTEKEQRSERYPQGEVISRIMNDTEALRELMTSGSFGIFIDFFFVVSCLVAFISLNLVSGLFLTAAEIIASVLLVWGSRYMRDIFLDVRKSRGYLFRTVANVVGGIKETFYTKHDNYASKKGEIVFDDFLKKQLVANIWDAGYYSVAESLYPLLLALVVFIFPYSQITEAAIIFGVVDLIQRSINPVKSVASRIANIQRAYSGIIRISEFMNDLDTLHTSKGRAEIKRRVLKSFRVKVDHFEYPKNEEEKDKSEKKNFALKEISFDAAPGTLVGIVGPSGCGKSTLLNIMAANIIPKQAKIEVECAETKEIVTFPGNTIEDIIDYRDNIGIVSQDSHIFSESVQFNITMSNKDSASFEDFWTWIKEQIPYLNSWGISPKDILDQKMLSMGQKQLLAAVRSCYLKKNIVLFDEISSGLDSEVELALRKVVLLIQESSLTFIVAHRLETIIQANKILIMDKGEVIDSGTHESLQTSSQLYNQFLSELSQSH